MDRGGGDDRLVNGQRGNSDHDRQLVGGAHDWATPSTPWDDPLDLFDPRSFGFDTAHFPLGLVGAQSERDDAFAVDKAYDLQTRGGLSKPGRKRQIQRLGRIELEDFEDSAQKNAFLLIQGYAGQLFESLTSARIKKSTNCSALQESMCWFFGTQPTPGQADFDLACRVLEARADVFRLRLQYEFYLRWSVFSSRPDQGSAAYQSVGLPDFLAGEVAYHSGRIGRMVAELAWLQPGLADSALVESLPDEDHTDVREALAVLENKYVMAEQEGHWYTTGRNPAAARKRASSNKLHNAALTGGGISWAALW